MSGAGGEGPQAKETEKHETGGVNTAQDGGQCGGCWKVGFGQRLKSQPEPERMGAWRPG